jgi:hypothetical protein
MARRPPPPDDTECRFVWEKTEVRFCARPD